MRVMKKLLSGLLIGAFAMSMMACSSNSKSSEINFDYSGIDKAAKEVFESDAEDMYIKNENPVVLGQRKTEDDSDLYHYDAKALYLVNSKYANGINIEYIEFNSKEEADSYFEDFYTTRDVENASDHYKFDYKKGESGFYYYPLNPSFEYQALYFCGDRAMSVSAVDETRIETLCSFLDKLNLPHY